MSTPLIVACPVCRKRGSWLETKSRPFCSERCRLVDLGQWFAGGYAISEPLRPADFEAFENLSAPAEPDAPRE